MKRTHLLVLLLICTVAYSEPNYSGPDRAAESLFQPGTGILNPDAPEVVCSYPLTPTAIKLITPAELNFGEVQVGERLTLNFNFQNIDQDKYAGVTIYDIASNASQFTVSNPVSNYCLQSRRSLTFRIRFSPKTSGFFTGAIVITHSDKSGKTTRSFVNVSGTGTGQAEIVPSVSSLDFGRVTIGKSEDRSFVLRNTGTNSNIIQRMTCSDPAFSVVSPSFPQKIGAGGSFDAKVRFSPASQRSYSAATSIVNASGKVVATVRLSGIGTGLPDISVTPGQLDFGQFDLGTFNERSLSISNTGTADLIVQAFAFSDPQLQAIPDAPFTIGPSRSVQVKIRFRSSKLGPQTANLTINSNDQDESKVSVTLVGNVVEGKVGMVDRSLSSRIGANTVRTRGVQWVDYNNDGKLDLYLCGAGGNALFKNLGNGVFANVTVAAHVGNNGQDCQGASWADMDNDGDPDLMIVNASGPPVLLRNNKGSFSSAGRLAVASAGAGATAGGIVLDFNNDARIDLFIVKNGSPNQLFRATGLFQFVDVASSAHVDYSGPGRAAVAADFNDDGYQDLYVVNNNAPNRLYLNNKNETFKEIGASAGVAFNGDSVQAVVGDYDGDGDLDLFVVNNGGPSVLYKNLFKKSGTLKFQNATASAGLTGPMQGRAATFSDIDNDGDQDLILVQSSGGNVVFKNIGNGRFAKVTNVDIDDSTDPSGVGSGDYNNDGEPDVVIGDGGNDPGSNDSLYANTGGAGNHHLTLILQGTSSNRTAIGTIVVLRAGLLIQAQQVSGGNGSSQESTPLEFGLGANTTANLLIKWPSGKIETRDGVAADQILRIEESAQ